MLPDYLPTLNNWTLDKKGSSRIIYAMPVSGLGLREQAPIRLGELLLPRCPAREYL